MAGYLTNQEVSDFTGDYNLHFETFQRNIVVHKEPIKTFALNDAPVYAGYSSPENNVTYTPVSGVYPALVSYSIPSNPRFKTEMPTVLSKEGTKIKVRGDAKNFIENGITLRIDVDGQSYKSIDGYVPQNFQGLIFYIYSLSKTT